MRQALHASTTDDLMLQAAQRILDSAAAGRIYSDMTMAWARRIVAQNATTKGASA